MTPNLFLATQTLFSPHKWFKSQPKGERLMRKQEHWDNPVAGIYEYIPGRGWYLVAKDIYAQDGSQSRPSSEDHPNGTATDPNGVNANRETTKVMPPVPVKYSKVLKRYLLAPDYDVRKRHGRVQPAMGKPYTAGFFRLDDGVAWVECWDPDGEFIPGPYKLWCIDQATGNFRHMLKGDDPAYVQSRNNSIEGNLPSSRRRNSQDSRSTQFRSGPGSTRDGPSVPSTRPSSIKTGSNTLATPSQPASRSGSKPGSRPGSPKRNPSLPLEEAKERLRVMAMEQNARSRSRANSAESRRGRSGARKDASPL